MLCDIAQCVARKNVCYCTVLWEIVFSVFLGKDAACITSVCSGEECCSVSIEKLCVLLQCAAEK